MVPSERGGRWTGNYSLVCSGLSSKFSVDRYGILDPSACRNVCGEVRTTGRIMNRMCSIVFLMMFENRHLSEQWIAVFVLCSWMF